MSSRSSSPAPPRHCRGVALLTAMLVVALSTASVVAMVSARAFEARRTTNILHADQALQHALGVEAWARGELATPGAPVAAALEPTAIDGGVVSGRIELPQGRLNLNRLWLQDTVNVVELGRLRRLLVLLDLPPGLADAIVDWIDPDLEPLRPDGAEDDWYQRLAVPYRAANRPLATVGELRLVRGVTPAVFAALAPHVTALPASAMLDVSVAAPLVMRTLDERIDAGLAERLVAIQPYADPEAFATQLLLRDIGRPIDVVVASQHVVVRGYARVGEAAVLLTSRLQRGERESRLLGRVLGEDDG